MRPWLQLSILNYNEILNDLVKKSKDIEETLSYLRINVDKSVIVKKLVEDDSSYMNNSCLMDVIYETRNFHYNLYKIQNDLRAYTDTYLLRVRSAMCIGAIKKMEEEESDDSSLEDRYYIDYESLSDDDDEKPSAKKTRYSLSRPKRRCAKKV